MKKGIFATLILLSLAMVACTNTANEGTGENDAFKALEKRREYYKNQDKAQTKMSEMSEMNEMSMDDSKAKEEAEKEALKVLEKKRAKSSN